MRASEIIMIIGVVESVFSSNPGNVLVDFKQAKKIGAKYVISKNSIKNTYLEIVCENCSNFYKLYKIK